MRKTYYELLLDEQKFIIDRTEPFEILQLENISKLKETGSKTLHKAHPTRDWLYQRHFIQACNNSPLCPTCRVPQTQTHILNECQTTEPIRKSLNPHLTPNFDYEQIPETKTDRFLYRIGENKLSNNISIEDYFINMFKKYNTLEDCNHIFST